MALTNPRVYTWVPDRQRPGAPFVAAEHWGDPRYPYNRWLMAGDGHRIPFPRRILSSDNYWTCQWCRVQILVEDGVHPTYPGVNYVMEIQISGDRRLTRQAAAVYQQISPGSPRIPALGAAGPVAQGVVAVARPSDLAHEGRWVQRVTRWEDEVNVMYVYLPN